MALINPNTACKCTGTLIPTNNCTQQAISNCNCIQVCHILVGAANSVNPCNTAGVVDITNAVTLPCNSSGATYEIASHTDNLTAVTINASQIAFTSNWSDGEDFQKAEIEYIVRDGDLSDSATVTIVFDQINNPDLCASGTTYDPCSGNCVADGPDLEVN